MHRSGYSWFFRCGYSQLLRLAVPLMLCRLLWRSRRAVQYRQKLAQRLALHLPSPMNVSAQPVWIHVVSVGETLAVAPLINRLLQDKPDVPLLLTSTTPTGAAQVRKLFSTRVHHCWMPFDTPGAVRRFLDHFRPRAIALVETEIWPNLIAIAGEREVPVLLLNARLSARSARGYGRIGCLARPAIMGLCVIAAQHRSDARRFRALGADKHSVRQTGSIKYDIDEAALRAHCARIHAQLGGAVAGRSIWVAGSTHPGEEDAVITAFRAWRERVPAAMLILAPRHPERAGGLLKNQLAGLVSQRRSDGGALAEGVDVLLWDTLGELAAVTGLAAVVFVGGSLVPRGGHNPLEAAVWGVPVLTGPHVFNFDAIYAQLFSAGAAEPVSDASGLTRALLRVTTNAGLAQQMSTAGRRVVSRHRGAVERQLMLVTSYLD